MQTTKNLLTEAQRIADVGLCSLTSRGMVQSSKLIHRKEIKASIASNGVLGTQNNGPVVLSYEVWSTRLKLWNTRYYRFLTNLRAEDDWKPHGSSGVGFGPFPCCINDHHWHSALPSPSTIQRNAQKQKRHLTTIPNTDPSLPNTAPEAEDMMGTILVVWPNLPRNKSRSLPKSYKISQLPFPASLSHYQRQVGTSVWISVRLFIVMSFPSFIRAARLI